MFGAARNCLELLGTARICSDLLGAAHNCSELLGAARGCSELLGAARSCSGLLNAAERVERYNERHPHVFTPSQALRVHLQPADTPLRRRGRHGHTAGEGTQGGGGDSTPSYPRMCGLKLEGNGSFLSLEGGKRCPPIWV